MGLFEHIAVLMSLVFAVAMTHLLASATEIILNRHRVRISWLHMAWMLLAFAVLYTNWLALWDERHIDHWDVGRLTMQFAVTVIQYFTCSLVSPKIPDEGQVDLFAFEARQRPIYVGAEVALTVLAAIGNYVLRDAYPRQPQSWLMQDLMILPMSVLLIGAMFWSNRVYQWIAVSAVLAMDIFFTLQFTLT